MNPDLEALIRAYDAVLEARDGSETKSRRAIFESRLDDAAEKTRVDKERLRLGIRLMHSDWIHAQKKTSSIPPKA